MSLKSKIAGIEPGHKAGKHLSLALIPTPGAVHGSHDVPNEIFLEEVWATGYCQWRARINTCAHLDKFQADGEIPGSSSF